MGTRSVTIFMDDHCEAKELCRVYRHYDGYPHGHGLQLARLCDVRLTNGILGDGCGMANGMGCLAAQVIAGLKHACKDEHRPSGVGNIYVSATTEPIGDWIEYVYTVTGHEDDKPVIACRTQTGTPPFNTQPNAAEVFSGTPADWIAKYATKIEEHKTKVMARS